MWKKKKIYEQNENINKEKASLNRNQKVKTELKNSLKKEFKGRSEEAKERICKLRAMEIIESKEQKEKD